MPCLSCCLQTLCCTVVCAPQAWCHLGLQTVLKRALLSSLRSSHALLDVESGRQEKGEMGIPTWLLDPTSPWSLLKRGAGPRALAATYPNAGLKAWVPQGHQPWH